MEEQVYTVFIAEDEHPARELLLDYLLEHHDLKLAGIAKNGEEALEKISAENYDLLLMDIHLPVYSGIEVIQKLKYLPYIIFTTAYDEYAIRAFEIGAIDYLLKPFSRDRFNQAINRFLELKKTDRAMPKSPLDLGLSFREKGKHYLLAYDSIIYLSSHAKHTIIHTEEKDFEAPLLLKNVEGKLPGDIFSRIHKQFVVNTRFISGIEYNIGGQYIAYLKDSEENTLPVGRTYASKLKEKLKI